MSPTRAKHGATRELDERRTFTVDIELTNRCNAQCHFCPRDTTPHQGTMTREVFEQSLARALEYRELMRDLFDGDITISLCGLGEPLLNRQAPEFVHLVRQAGLTCFLSSNGAPLDEACGRALLDAGLQVLLVNAGEEGTSYEQVYKLPFEKTRDNVLRFAEMAGDDCKVIIVLVDHRRDPDHVERMMQYWERQGLDQFLMFDIMNRSGSLFVDHMQFEAFPEIREARTLLAGQGPAPFCAAPFVYLFIGYDGRYYLCCSDWKKEVPLGSVFDTSFRDITRRKLEYVQAREPICKTCNHDPLNRLTAALRAITTGNANGAARDALLEEIVATGKQVRRDVDEIAAAR